MRDLLIACMAGIALAGCTSADQSTLEPSGKIAHQAICSGSVDGCKRKAAQDCNGPYRVLDSSSNAGGLVADAPLGPVTWYRMSYQCGPSDRRTPTFSFRGQRYAPPPIDDGQPRAPVVCRSMNAPVGHPGFRCASHSLPNRATKRPIGTSHPVVGLT